MTFLLVIHKEVNHATQTPLQFCVHLLVSSTETYGISQMTPRVFIRLKASCEAELQSLL